MFKDEKLKAVIVVQKGSKEILALLTNDGNMIEKEGIEIILDYSKNSDKNIRSVETLNKRFFYIKEED